MSNRKPAEVFHPGVQIREEMEARGWTVEELAAKLRWGTQCAGRILVNALVDGEMCIRPITAERLARAFGTTEVFWQNLQKAYDDAG